MDNLNADEREAELHKQLERIETDLRERVTALHRRAQVARDQVYCEYVRLCIREAMSG